MSTLSLNWSISTIQPAIDRCGKLCAFYADNGNGVFPFGDLTQQLGKLDSASQSLQDQPLVTKTYIDLEAIAKTLEQCQVFLNPHHTSLLQGWTDVDLNRNADLTKRLELHTQTLEVYQFLLKRSEVRLVRRATLPAQDAPLVNFIPPDSQQLTAELNEVKQLRSLLNECSDKINVSHRDATDCVRVGLANIAATLEGQITRSQNKARLGPGWYNNQQTQNIVEPEAPGSRASIRSHAGSVNDRTGSISSISNSAVASLNGAISSSIHSAAEPPTHVQIENVKIRFRIANNPEQTKVHCTLEATIVGDWCVAIAVLPENDRPYNLSLPVLNFCLSPNRPIPIRRWRGGRTQEGEHDFVVTLSSTDCVQPQESLSDLEYRFNSEPACRSFQGFVYGKELGESVNVHKLQLEDRRGRRTSLCESSVIYFWRDLSSPGNQLGDYTMLYFENSRVDRPKELPLRYVQDPGPRTFGRDGARLPLKDGSKSVIFEFSRQNGQRDLQKLKDFLERYRNVI